MSPLWSGLIGLIFTPNNLISVLKHNCSSETHWVFVLGLPTTKALASPKSANFKRISLSIRRFWGLNFSGLTREIPMLQNRWAKGSRTWCLYEWCAWPQRSKKTWSFPILEKLSDVCSISQTARKLRCFSLLLWIYVKIYGYIYIYCINCIYIYVYVYIYTYTYMC